MIFDYSRLLLTRHLTLSQVRNLDCLQSTFSLEVSWVIKPKQHVHKKWHLNEKRLGRDEKRRTADSFVIFKPSANPATEQLIGQFIADDRSLSDQGASLFILISLPNITFVWPPGRKNDFLFLLFKTTVHNKISIFEHEGLFHPNHDPCFSVGDCIFGSDEGILAAYSAYSAYHPLTALTIHLQRHCTFLNAHLEHTVDKNFRASPNHKSASSKLQKETCPFCFSTHFLPGIINNISHVPSNVGGLYFERTIAKDLTLLNVFCWVAEARF